MNQKKLNIDHKGTETGFFTNNKLLIAVYSFLVLIHISYIFNGFIWLDHNDIEQKFAVLPLSQIYKAFLIPFGQTSFYRPVVTIINSIDYALYGNWAPGYHITSLIIYFLAIYAASKFITVFFNLERKYLALLILLMGISPVGIFISGAINQRQESLLLLFTSLTVYLYVKKSRALSVLFFSLALFTKETALVIIPILLIMSQIHSLQLRPIIFSKIYKNITNYIKFNWKIVSAYLLIVLFYLSLRHNAVPKLWTVTYPDLTLEGNIAVRIELLKNMLFDLVRPLKPSISDATRILKLSSLSVILTSFCVGSSLIYSFLPKTEKRLSGAIQLTLILLMPGLNFVPVPRLGSPHYSFLVLPFFLSVVLISIQIQKKLLKTLIFIIIAVWTVVSAFSTFTSGFNFQNDETFFKTEVSQDPDFSEGYYYLGNYFLKKGNFDEASQYYIEALKYRQNIVSFKDDTSATVNLASSYFQMDKINEADTLYSSVYNKVGDPVKPYVIFNLALIAQKRNDNQQIIKLLEGKDWNFPEAYLLLAQTYKAEKNTSKEAETLKKVIPLVSESERTQFEGYIKSIE